MVQTVSLKVLFFYQVVLLNRSPPNLSCFPKPFLRGCVWQRNCLQIFLPDPFVKNSGNCENEPTWGWIRKNLWNIRGERVHATPRPNVSREHVPAAVKASDSDHLPLPSPYVERQTLVDVRKIGSGYFRAFVPEKSFSWSRSTRTSTSYKRIYNDFVTMRNIAKDVLKDTRSGSTAETVWKLGSGPSSSGWTGPNTLEFFFFTFLNNCRFYRRLRYEINLSFFYISIVRTSQSCEGLLGDERVTQSRSMKSKNFNKKRQEM